ncbi:MAG TPA: hypothetical protein V6C89_21790 [Drouetiella sp.]
MTQQDFMSVKQAAEILNLDERSVRIRLMNGQLEGEKKLVGLKEKWFVNAAAVEAAASRFKEFNPGSLEQPAIETIIAESIDVSIDEDVDAHQTELESDCTSIDWLEKERTKLRILAEEMVQPLLQMIRDQERELHQKNLELRLLPDLAKQAEQRAQERDLLHNENAALKKQVAAISAKLHLEQSQHSDSNSKHDLEAGALKNQIAELSNQVAEATRPWWKRFQHGGRGHRV